MEGIGFIVEHYDTCVSDNIVNGNQFTITWHVDDLKTSHINSTKVDNFILCIKSKYEDEEIGKVKASRGQKHNYLVMDINFSVKGKLSLNMGRYIKETVDNFTFKI